LQKRLSPKQISFLGDLGTTGADAVDYLFTDEYTISKEQVEFYSEIILFMKKTFLPFDDSMKLGAKDISKKEYELS
tara:strand:+ start:653 stop:880 length:228 start_codon:yes stop_codon:yes gene_type:complete